MARLHLSQSAPDGGVSGYEMQRKIKGESFRIPTRFNTGIGGGRHQLRRVNESVRTRMVIQRLFTESIARQMQLPVVRIGDRERIHAVQPLEQAAYAPLLVAVGKHFGVGMSVKAVAAAF